jgi:DNA-binding MarR family transcriptional regulator
MNNSQSISIEYHLQILEVIDQNPQITQADLATQLGIAVGTVNWYLKRLISKGYIKIRRMQRRRLLYLITPRGIAEKSRLGVLYMRASLQVYRETRVQAIRLLSQAHQAGYDQIVIEGEEDLAEICRLTCLEQGMKSAKAIRGAALPALQADGLRLKLTLPERR